MGTIDRTIGPYHDASNARIRKIGRFVGPASYATGGDPLTPASLGLSFVEVIHFEPFTNGTVIIFGEYEVAAQTVKFYDLTGAEIAALTDLSTYAARFEAIGH